MMMVCCGKLQRNIDDEIIISCEQTETSMELYFSPAIFYKRHMDTYGFEI